MKSTIFPHLSPERLNRLHGSRSDLPSTMLEPKWAGRAPMRFVHLQINIGGDTDEDVMDALECLVDEYRRVGRVGQRAYGELATGLEVIMWRDPTMTRKEYNRAVLKYIKSRKVA